MNRGPRFLMVGVIALPIFYVALYFSGTHSEAFHFLEKAIRGSSEVHRRIGQVNTVHLSFLGGYHEIGNSSTEHASMTIDVTGTRGDSISIVASAEKRNGTWTVLDASVDGEPVHLE
jgi:hypothetical protein